MATDRTKVALYWYDADRPKSELWELRQIDREAAARLVTGGRNISVKQPGWFQPKPYEPSHFEVAKAVLELKRRGRVDMLDVQAVREFYVRLNQQVPAPVMELLVPEGAAVVQAVSD